MPRTIGYTYDADTHCLLCMLLDAADKKLTRQHGYLIDSEGNEVRPIFDTDETDNPYCGDCGKLLD